MKKVGVTGAEGYVGSWVVKLLLTKGYMVHGTVRDPCDDKTNGHLKQLENSQERLHLFKAELLDYEAFCTAFDGCTGVFHIASPVPSGVVANPQEEVLDPAILGTRNVLNACLKAKVKKLVVVSSVAAVIYNPEWPLDREADESCWTNIEYVKSIENWYSVSKTLAEIEAMKFAKRDDFIVVTICPAYAIGPMLQSTINASSSLFLSYMKEEDRSRGDTMENAEYPVVDVRDLSEAILLVYENPESKGRYICSAYTFMMKEFVAKLKSIFPGYDYPKIFTEKSCHSLPTAKKLQKLGWHYRPLEETIVDYVKNYEELGLLERGKSFPSLI